MKLNNLKAGQQFKFASGHKKEGVYVVLNTSPLTYKALRGSIHYQPTYGKIGESQVIVVGEDLPIEASFTDTDGDRIKVTAETEADFVHVLVSSDRYQSSTIAALSREDVLKLITFLEGHLQIK